MLLPLGLILAVLAAWKLGMGPVLSFWLAYILTRPLGANIGDYLASPRADGGLGLGTLGTSVLFLGTILAVVVYLTVTDKDRTEASNSASSGPRSPTRSEETTMAEIRTHRVLVVTDTAEPTKSLRDAIRHRAENGDVQFRLIVLNPARAELHLLHPERHDKADRGRDQSCARRCRSSSAAAHAPVIGSVSVRHDPMDAIEETMFSEPVDEIMLDVPPHHLSSWLHQDLEHRLAHFQIPVTTVRHDIQVLGRERG